MRVGSALLIAMLLAGLARAGESEHVSPFLPRGPQEDKNAEQHAQEVKKKLQEAQERAVKQLEEETKKREEKKDSGKKFEKSKEHGPASPFVAIPTSDKVKVAKIEFDPEAAKKHKKGESIQRPLEFEDPREAATVFEFPDAGKGTLKRSGENIYEITPPNGKGMNVLPVNQSLEAPEHKRSFWDKLTGQNKDPKTKRLEAQEQETAGIGLSRPSASADNVANRDSLLRRLQAEMLKLHADEASRQQADRQARDPNAKAAVVPLAELPAKQEAADPGAAGEAVPAAELEAQPLPRLPAAEPSTPEEWKKALEDRYRRGISSADLVEREWAYQFASAARRADAQPYLVRELKSNGMLNTLAATVLGNLGQASPDAVLALTAALDAKEPPLRIAAARSLGQLKVPAARALVERLKTERNFTVRAAYCEALGWMGEPLAREPLRAIVHGSEDVEVVRANAAVSLARMGDREGRTHLARILEHPMPQLQVLGLVGLCALGGTEAPGYVVAALESPYEEVWTTALFVSPQLGPARVLPALSARLAATDERIRRRAAIAMGLLGSDEGAPYLVKSLRQGSIFERQMAAALLGALQHREYAPELIAALRDSSSSVRQAAAIALTRMDVKEAVPALLDAARGAKSPQALPPALRGAMPDINELMTLLSAVRVLKGEEDTLVLESLPETQENRWPEYDREVFKYQLELIKTYKVEEVLSADGRPVGAVLIEPSGKEKLVRPNENVAAGFTLADMGAGAKGAGADWVNLRRGDTRVTLTKGRPADVFFGEYTRRDLKLRPEDLKPKE